VRAGKVTNSVQHWDDRHSSSDGIIPEKGISAQ